MTYFIFMACFFLLLQTCNNLNDRVMSQRCTYSKELLHWIDKKKTTLNIFVLKLQYTIFVIVLFNRLFLRERTFSVSSSEWCEKQIVQKRLLFHTLFPLLWLKVGSPLECSASSYFHERRFIWHIFFLFKQTLTKIQNY